MALKSSELPNRPSAARQGPPMLIPMGAHAGRPPILLNRPVFVIGSRRNARIHLMSSTVSKAHALLIQTRHATYLRDLASRTHTYVDGKPIREVVLQDGATVGIGRFTFQYRGPGSQPETELNAMPAVLQVDNLPSPVRIDQRVLLIGKRKSSDLPLVDDSVSTAHAVIFQWEGKRFIRDLGSRTGTSVNGKTINEVELRAGDHIGIGRSDIEYVPSAFSSTGRPLDGIANAAAAEMLDAAPLEEQPPVAPEAFEPLDLERQPEFEGAPEPISAPVSNNDESLESADLLEPLEEASAGDQLAPPMELIASEPLAATESSHSEPDPQPTPAEEESELALEPLVLDSSDDVHEAPISPHDTAGIPIALDIDEESETPAKAEPIPEVPLPSRGWHAPAAPEVTATTDSFTTELPSATDFSSDNGVGIIPEAPDIASEIETHPPPAETARDESPGPIVTATTDSFTTELPSATDFSSDNGVGVVPVARDVSPAHEANPPAADIARDESQVPPPLPDPESPPPAPQVQPSLELDFTGVSFDVDHSRDASAPAVDEAPGLLPSPESTDAPAEPTRLIELDALSATKPLDIQIEPRGIAPAEAPLIAADAIIAPAAEAPARRPRARRPRKLSSLASDQANDETKSAPAEPLTAVAEVRQSPLPPVAPTPPVHVEIFEPTQPTPESAQSLDEPVADRSLDGGVTVEPPPADSSETRFGKEVAAFTSDSTTGPLVIEPTPTVAEPQPQQEQVATVTNLTDTSTFAPREQQTFTGERAGEPPSPDVAAEVAPDAPAVAEPVPDVEPPPIPALDLDESASTLELPEEPPTPAEPAPAPPGAAGNEAVPSKPAPTEEPAPQARVDIFKNWSANQEHFLGGVMAKTPPTAPLVTAPLIPQPTPRKVEPPPRPASPFSKGADFAALLVPPLILETPKPVGEPPVNLGEVEPLQLDSDAEEPIAPLEEEPRDDEPAGQAAEAPLDEDKALALLDELLSPELPEEPLKLEEPAAPAAAVVAPEAEPAPAMDELALEEPPPKPIPEAPPPQVEAAAIQPPAPPAAAPQPPPFEIAPPGETSPAAAPAPKDAAPKDVASKDVAPPVQERPPASPPLRPRGRSDVKPTVIRDAFGKQSRKKLADVEVPPFAQKDAGDMGGLVTPPARVMDVFSHSSPESHSFTDSPEDAAAMTPMDLVRPEADSIEATEGSTDADATSSGALASLMSADEVAAAARVAEIGRPPNYPAGAQKPLVPPRRPRASDKAVGPRRPTVTYGEQDYQHLATQRRRSRLRRVPVLLAVMGLLIVAAWPICFYLIPPRTQVQATVKFSNFDAVTQREQRMLQADQARYVSQEDTRNNARRILANRHENVAAGFLGDAVAFAHATDADHISWPPGRNGTMILQYEGTDPQGDVYRVEALATALYEANINSPAYKSAHASSDAVAQLKAQIDTGRQRREGLVNGITREREIAESRPTPAQIAALQTERDRLEQAYNNAIATRKSAAADLDQLKHAALPADSSTQPFDPTADDAQLARMLKEADALTEKLSASRADRAAAADAAKKALDAAVDKLNKEIEAAQPLLTGQNTELWAYVSSAQNLQAAIQAATEEYVQRQQPQYLAFAELVAKRDQKVQARRSELWANDTQLRQLNEQKEIAARKLAAAQAAKSEKDASDLQNDLKLIDNTIKARQEVIANDPLYADEINQLQAAVEQQQKEMDEDRRRTDERLDSLQKTFAQMQPAVEKVPADQKQVASAVKNRLDELTQARNGYAAAFESAAAGDNDAAVKQASADLSALRANIDARRKQILIAGVEAVRNRQKQSRQQAIDAKEKEVAGLAQAEKDSQAAFLAKNNELLKAQSQLTEARASGERLLQMQRDLDILDRQLEQNAIALDYKQREVGRIIEPVQPVSDDVRAGPPVRQAMMYAAGSSLGIFILFSSWILLTLLGAARESTHPFASVAPTPPPPSNQPKQQDSAQDDESAPATV